HKDSCRSYVAANCNDHQQSLHATMVVTYGRKQIIHDLGGSIPLADRIQKHHLSNIFEQHYEQLRGIFCVDFIFQVNNVTVGQLVLKTLVEWEIPFTYPYLIVSDSAAYIKKSVRKILQP
ncbi:10586_t:CDS:2, partial [Diversispora eburnea]